MLSATFKHRCSPPPPLMPHTHTPGCHTTPLPAPHTSPTSLHCSVSSSCPLSLPPTHSTWNQVHSPSQVYYYSTSSEPKRSIVDNVLTPTTAIHVLPVASVLGYNTVCTCAPTRSIQAALKTHSQKSPPSHTHTLTKATISPPGWRVSMLTSVRMEAMELANKRAR